MSFPRYEEYKDSGLDWLGAVPAHWNVPPCRAIVTERSKRNDDGICEDYLSLMANIGVIPYADKGDIGNKKPEDLSKCKMVHEGDFVINSMNYYIGSYGISPYNGVCSPVYIVLTPRNDVVDSRFAFRIFEDDHFQEYAQSFGNGILEHRRSINWDILKTIPVPVPPPDEQHAIASFLDRETSKIDTLVSEQRRLVELLKEKRQAVISHAVTKGLDPTVPMKPSGIVGIGQVPEHWSLKKLGWLLRESPKNGTSPPINANGQTPTFSIAAVKNGTADIINHLKYADISPEDAAPYLVHQHDILILRGNGNKALVGTAGIVTNEPPPNCIYPDILIRVRPSKQITPWFLVSILNSEVIRPTVEMAAQTASGVWKISGQSLQDLRLAIPPPNEQRDIERQCCEQMTTFDRLLREAERAIILLQERRTALISAAVTGKIDVRAVALEGARP